MLKKRNYKKIITQQIIGKNKDESITFQLTPIVDKLLTNLDNGVNTCLEAKRQTRKTYTVLMYAKEILLKEKEGYIIIYSNSTYNGLMKRSIISQLIVINNPDISTQEIQEIQGRIIINPTRRDLIDKNILLEEDKSEVLLIIYDDLANVSSLNNIDFDMAKDYLSVIISHDISFIEKQKGIENFEICKIELNEK